jgi:8-oxo-dGTP pyrophosphatase MutT (NUDIX family)
VTLDHGRATLLAELERYVPSSDGERAMRERLRAFVAGHPDCFERTHLAGHVTGSAWIVDRAGEAAVLTHHRKLGKWLQLGGHADGDSDIRRVARREAVEESGLAGIESANDGIYDIDVHEIPARGAEPAHLHYDVRFAFYAERGSIPVANDESHAVAWVPLAEIERFAIDDSVRRLVAKTASLVEGSFSAAEKREPA